MKGLNNNECVNFYRFCRLWLGYSFAAFQCKVLLNIYYFKLSACFYVFDIERSETQETTVVLLCVWNFLPLKCHSGCLKKIYGPTY
jgi:hypothetical protein